MADIRVTGILDPTDDRGPTVAPEIPLDYGGRWSPYGSYTDDLALLAYGVGPAHYIITASDQTPSTPQQAHSYWTPSTFDGDVEVWAHLNTGLDDGASMSLGLISSAGGYGGSWDGYHLRIINTFSASTTRWEIYRIDNGSATLVASTLDSVVSLPSGDHVVLFRRSGNDLQGYKSSDDGLNWTLGVSVTDSTYTTGMNVGVGTSVQSITDYPGWYTVGGGVDNWMPEFIRRPWEYSGGYPLT